MLSTILQDISILFALYYELVSCQLVPVEVNDSHPGVVYATDVQGSWYGRWDNIVASRDIINGVCRTASGICESSTIDPSRTKNGK